MKQKFFARTIFLIILILSFVTTTVTIFPQVATADSSTALEALDRGVELQEQGDLEQAMSSYQEAIELARSEVKVFISAKKYLATIKENEGDTDEANELYKEVEAGYLALGAAGVSIQCGDCGCTTTGKCYEWRRNGSCTRCK